MTLPTPGAAGSSSGGSGHREWPPMTATGRWVVGVGAALLLGALAVLVFGDVAVFRTCKTVTTFEPIRAAASGSASPRPTGPSSGASQGSVPTPKASSPESAPKPKASPGQGSGGLIEVKRIETCSPSDLKGGIPLVMAVLGAALVSPGLLRVLPPGKYGVGGASADTTNLLGERANAITESASFDATAPVPGQAGAATPPSPPGSP